MKKITVADIVKELDLTIFYGEEYLDRIIGVKDISRPGLVLAGYFDYYPTERIQVLGKTELSFYYSLDEETQVYRANKLLVDPIPCVILSRSFPPPNSLLEVAKSKKIPILGVERDTTQFISVLTNLLDNLLAPTKTIHGVLVDIYGVGVLILGQSGIGKSETALELVKRGHRLVSDDAVVLKKVAKDSIIGSAPDILKHLLEIRGVGLIDVVKLFGMGSVRGHKEIDIVVRLEVWQQDKAYERLGLDNKYYEILGVNIPLMEIPVAPGRNLAIIMEVAAMNHRSLKMGNNTPEEFNQRLLTHLKSNTKLKSSF
ncbi:Hpr(Ser) kinase/phosphatase [Anaerobranca californiensis DSM 14826]|uniref:HPr kinase/phosphorylase n=1 Tax=Anaerobranca californiensis DSM 14826 TaxID=1120989 RepID=A0A1M6NNJ2_9FIRM|nr:HPr(Ser) kinase/phosphatase [Anaerobranca californiensis]SHJ97255.1 Hpr(Ser) kinase/phosphatase [Anaerobranca californiensis DSM 14826]